MVRLGWGREDLAFRRFFTSSFIPDAPPEMWESFAELLRRTTSAENAARLLESWAQIDVTAEAARVTAPTLVLHARDELGVPLEQARRLAALIPGARFVPLDSRNRYDEAVTAYDRALDLTISVTERRFLNEQRTAAAAGIGA